MTEVDRIEKRVFLKATRSRVWRALTTSAEFGAWFGAAFDGPFVAGASVHGTIVPTRVDAQIAAAQKPYEGAPIDLLIERMDAEHTFSFRWHPGADGEVGGPTTLVAFELVDAPGGILLTITESGFAALPLERRAKAFADNEGGWEAQAMLIEKYVVETA